MTTLKRRKTRTRLLYQLIKMPKAKTKQTLKQMTTLSSLLMERPQVRLRIITLKTMLRKKQKPKRRSKQRKSNNSKSKKNHMKDPQKLKLKKNSNSNSNRKLSRMVTTRLRKLI